MDQQERIAQHLVGQIVETHARFAAAMEARLPAMELEQKERYFAVLSMLVGKLEDAAKPMKQVIQELVSDALPIVITELS
ncbi:MAG: hypothetical protein QOD06_1650 [Candidatus Binatota bacterium]|jgi:hypothetical protein|nr:hypothetical protein [Candidatus Binatota bacterium]